MNEISINLKEKFNTVEKGTHYQLPMYELVDGKGIQETSNVQEIRFVRGSKLKDEEVEKREGTLHEHLLAMMIEDLKYKNSLVPSRETACVITKLQEALGWLRERQIDRIKRDIEGTYKS